METLRELFHDFCYVYKWRIKIQLCGITATLRACGWSFEFHGTASIQVWWGCVYQQIRGSLQWWWAGAPFVYSDFCMRGLRTNAWKYKPGGSGAMFPRGQLKLESLVAGHDELHAGCRSRTPITCRSSNLIRVIPRPESVNGKPNHSTRPSRSSDFMITQSRSSACWFH